MSIIHQQLINIVGNDGLLIEQHQMAQYCLDWRKRFTGEAFGVAFPANREQLISLVKFCFDKQIPIVPQGGNTSTCGAATPDDSGRSLIICLKRMNAILQVDPINNSIMVEAGAVLLDVQEAARKADRLFPLSLASEGSCQIGGNLSTNAGGMAVLRYGTMRDLTLGLEAVLPDGSVYSALSVLRKDSSGLDLKHLFIGAEGTLGIITAATLKLFALPHSRVTALIGLESIDDALLWLAELKQKFDQQLTTFELISQSCMELVAAYKQQTNIPFVTPWAILIELSANEHDSKLQQEALEWLSNKEDMLDGVIAKSEKERKDLWAIRENIAEAQKAMGFGIKHDIAVPISNMSIFLQKAAKQLQLAYPSVKLIIFGHLGDGSLHYNVYNTADNCLCSINDEKNINNIVYDIVYCCDGTISAEHGIGQLKPQWLARYKPAELMQTRKKIKSCFDPLNLFNPGKLY